MRDIIGLIGKKGHGKNALADAIELASKREVVQVAFAGALKEAARIIFRLDDEQLHGRRKEEVDPRWNKTPREILQLLGTEVGRSIDREVWIKSVRAQAEAAWTQNPGAIVVVTDVRFENEAEFILAMRGLLVRVSMPEKQAGLFEAHASEIEQEGIIVHAKVENDGTLAQLDSAGRWVESLVQSRKHGRIDRWRFVCSEEQAYNGPQKATEGPLAGG